MEKLCKFLFIEIIFVMVKFGEEKCAVMRVENGKIINSDKSFKINNLKIKRNRRRNLKYLGQDENFTYNDSVNKEGVSSEYFKRVCIKSRSAIMKKVYENETEKSIRVTNSNGFFCLIFVHFFVHKLLTKFNITSE